jgi:hypothetical protein
MALCGRDTQFMHWGFSNLIPLTPFRQEARSSEAFLPLELARKYESIAQYRFFYFNSAPADAALFHFSATPSEFVVISPST